MLKSTWLQRKSMFILFAILIIFGWWISHFSSAKINYPISALIHTHAGLQIPAGSPLRTHIHAQPVFIQNVSIPFDVPATVQALPSKVLDLIPPAAGKITQIHRSLGDWVTRGDVLYTLTAPDIIQAMNDLNQAKAAYELAHQTYLRQQKMYRANLNALNDLQQARMGYDQAVSERARAHARLDLFKIDPKDLRPDGRLNIRSALSGQVQAINVAPGAFWSDLSSAVMTVVDLSKVYVVANVQERDLKAVYVGQQAELKFSDNQKITHTRVTYIQPMLNADTRTLDVGMLVPNPDFSLKPNAFITATMLRKPAPRIVLPLTAVIQRGFESIVFVEVAPWVFAARKVEVGFYVKQGVEIISGLNNKERVVLTEGILLND